MKRLHQSLALILMLAAIAAMPAAAAVEPSIGKLPAGWVEREPMDESIARYFIYQEKATVMAELLIFEEELPSPISTREYLDAVKINGMPNFGNYSPIEDEAVTLHGREMMIHRFHFSNQQGLLKGEAYAFAEETTGYLLLFDTTDPWFARMQPKFAQFVKEAVNLPEAPKPVISPVSPTTPKPEVKPAATVPATQPEKPEKVAEDGGEALPAFDDDEEEENGGLPQFEDEEEGFFSAAGWEIFIALPEGAEEVARNDEGVEVSGPDGSRIFIALFEDFETAGREAGKKNEGLRRHNTSEIKCGETTVEVTLYSGEQDGAKIAVLTAHWENTGGAVRISLPRENYSAAGDWIKEMLCSVKLVKK